ncbi:MAG: HAMP domain-containing histidine kinase [Ruminococcus sp.]|nr:HAMP domain-containing histidine kinase [Ruminococcus sp.]
MGNMTKKIKSLKTALLMYLPLCLAAVFAGLEFIGWVSDRFRSIYDFYYPIQEVKVSDGNVEWVRNGWQFLSFAAENAGNVMSVLWVIFCVSAAGYIFYARELKKPISILMDASKKIADNELDFHVKYDKENELGVLCGAFEDMRQKLFDSNLDIWHTLEERKRLSAAFSHDLRTPLTVLSGYVELLGNYGGKLSEEKRTEILEKMKSQITRLTNYTEKMNAVQKLEDISPARRSAKFVDICASLEDTGKLVCGDMEFSFTADKGADDEVYIDSELFMQVYENLVSNAVRYAESRITVSAGTSGDMLYVTVCDDGKGFSREALKNASKPFFRGEQNPDMHFGLGLYICRILCKKQGGELRIENGADGGGKVTAEIFSHELIKS